MTLSFRNRLRSGVAAAAICTQLVTLAGPASAFCGFYVAKADAKLFNKSSKVVLARDGTTTAITMANDYEGEPKEFALVVPVPTTTSTSMSSSSVTSSPPRVTNEYISLVTTSVDSPTPRTNSSVSSNVGVSMYP